MKIAMFKRLLLGSAVLAAPGFVSAQLATNLFIDTKAMSMGNAVTADRLVS